MILERTFKIDLAVAGLAERFPETVLLLWGHFRRGWRRGLRLG
jgi:hypothetical protein